MNDRYGEHFYFVSREGEAESAEGGRQPDDDGVALPDAVDEPAEHTAYGGNDAARDDERFPQNGYPGLYNRQGCLSYLRKLCFQRVP